MNNSRRDAPNLCLNPEMKSIDPKIKEIIAATNNNGAIAEGMFLFVIISTVCSKFIILQGIE